MKTTLILLTMSLCACSTVSKETYTERREFTYPKGTTPHLKHMYMHQDPEVRQPEVIPAEPIVQQPDQVDFDYVGDLPEQRTLEEVRAENDLLCALRANRILRRMQ